MPLNIRNPIGILPLNGVLDLRSSPDTLPPGAFRYKLNAAIDKDGKLARGQGWPRFMPTASVATYNNQDLHDQMLPLVSGSVREPVTYLQSAVAQDGSRHFYGGTRSRLYEWNEWTGAQKLIAWGWGGTTDEYRWHSATQSDYMIWTNGVDQVLYYLIGSPANASTAALPWQRVNRVQDLIDLNVSQVQVITQMAGCVILMNMYEGGVLQTARVRWSGYKKPLQYKTADASVAGFQDLDYGETILAAVPLGGSIYILTDRGVWGMTVNSGEKPAFSFQRIYQEPRNKQACIAYPNAAISDGENIWYIGLDGIYQWAELFQVPSRAEWLHVSTKEMFDKIDPTCCGAPVAGFYPLTKELWFSYPEIGKGCLNNRTLRVSVRDLATQQRGTADIVDYGFTAFANHQSDRQMSFAEWLLAWRICTEAQENSIGLQYVYEGLPRSGSIPYETSQTPNSLFSTASLTEDGIPVEDYDAVAASAGSLCALMDGLTVAEVCRQCNQDQLFVMAASADYCLKQYGGAYSREVCTNPTGRGTTITYASGAKAFEANPGTYDYEGYFTIFRGIFPFYKATELKLINGMKLEIDPAGALVPAYMQARIGTSYNAVDPNLSSGMCAPVWRVLDQLPIECPDLYTSQYMSDNNLTPDKGMEWALYEQGRFLSFEFKVANANGSAALGGGASFSAIYVGAGALGHG